MQKPFASLQAKIDQALKILGIRNFLLGIHDAAFPSLPEEDFGRGSPYSEGAAGFINFARTLGFSGIQLGPQGITTPANLSPYDATFFSKNPLSLAPLPLTRSGCNLLSPKTLAGFTGRIPPESTRISDTFARQATQCISAEACNRHRRLIAEGTNASRASLHDYFQTFRLKNATWLIRDALYEILRQHYGGKTWRHWETDEVALLDQRLFAPPAGRKASVSLRLRSLYRQHAQAIEDYSFIQFLLAAQHRELRQRCRNLGLKLFGDFQIGISARDAWGAHSFLLPDYVMGAPPSRTNPQGQPWNYPLLDPRRYCITGIKGCRKPGPAVSFLRTRIKKLVEEFDGLRLDHPHGLICPWVYKAGQEDPVGAVQKGARLFASPMLDDHPALAKFAIVRQDQLNTMAERHSDDWVTTLDHEQVSRYAQLFDVIMKAAAQRPDTPCEIACEILSTQPYPVKRVMELYGLGRFRVTQKADLDNELDVYRSENAQPEDWLMLGNHDTAPIWQVADNWLVTGNAHRQAEYLATRLRIPAAERAEWTERVSVDAGALVQAKFADLLIGPAQNIMVFFTDLLGSKETYNKPGTMSVANWTLRIPSNYKSIYAEKLAANHALDIPRGLAMALRARGFTKSPEHRQLIRELEDY